MTKAVILSTRKLMLVLPRTCWETISECGRLAASMVVS